MTAPDELWMATVLAEKDMDVRAGLPEEMRLDIERRDAIRRRAEQAKEARERIERLFASITEHESRIADLQKELEEAMHDYANATIRSPAA